CPGCLASFVSRRFLDLWSPASFPTRRSSDLLLRRERAQPETRGPWFTFRFRPCHGGARRRRAIFTVSVTGGAYDEDQCRCYNHRSEEHTSELQSRENLVCRLLLEKKNIPGVH